MAKRRKQEATKDESPEGRQSWVIYARVDPALQQATQSFIDSHEFPPHFARVLERAMIEFLQRRGYWPPKAAG